MDATRPTNRAICRFPSFEGSPGGLDGGLKSMISNWGLLYDVCVIMDTPDYARTMKDPQVIEGHMEHTLAMQIVGVVALLIGLRMNIDPVGFNKSIFGDVEGIESGESSAMRMAIGGGLLALAMVNIYCSFNVEDEAAGEAVLTGTAMGLAAFFVTVAAPKFRGYTDSIPTLPMVVLPTMIAICLYSALM